MKDDKKNDEFKWTRHDTMITIGTIVVIVLLGITVNHFAQQAIQARQENPIIRISYVESQTYLLGKHIHDGYLLSTINDDHFLVRKTYFFGGFHEITVPLEEGVLFNIGGKDFVLSDYSSSLVELSWQERKSIRENRFEETEEVYVGEFLHGHTYAVLDTVSLSEIRNDTFLLEQNSDGEIIDIVLPLKRGMAFKLGVAYHVLVDYSSDWIKLSMYPSIEDFESTLEFALAIKEMMTGT